MNRRRRRHRRSRATTSSSWSAIWSTSWSRRKRSERGEKASSKLQSGKWKVESKLESLEVEKRGGGGRKIAALFCVKCVNFRFQPEGWNYECGFRLQPETWRFNERTLS